MCPFCTCLWLWMTRSVDWTGPSEPFVSFTRSLLTLCLCWYKMGRQVMKMQFRHDHTSRSFFFLFFFVCRLCFPRMLLSCILIGNKIWACSAAVAGLSSPVNHNIDFIANGQICMTGQIYYRTARFVSLCICRCIFTFAGLLWSDAYYPLMSHNKARRSALHSRTVSIGYICLRTIWTAAIPVFCSSSTAQCLQEAVKCSFV